jgi:hypothetical protein
MRRHVERARGDGAVRLEPTLPWKIGKITAAALVLLHAGHGRIT